MKATTRARKFKTREARTLATTEGAGMVEGIPAEATRAVGVTPVGDIRVEVTLAEVTRVVVIPEVTMDAAIAGGTRRRTNGWSS